MISSCTNNPRDCRQTGPLVKTTVQTLAALDRTA